MNATNITYIVQAAGIGGVVYGGVALAHHYGPLIGLTVGFLLLVGGGWYRRSQIEKQPVAGIAGAIKG